MEHLYAPWRDEYIKDTEVKGCVFCHIDAHPELDEKHHVLYRCKDFFIVMNKYPYTPGHFMVIPSHHTDKLEELDPDVWIAMSAYVQKGVHMLKEGLGAHGVNLGMNLGAEAGAGIAEHVHYHLVPRWTRDTNFITSVGGTRVYSTDFEAIYQKLKALTPKYFPIT